MFSSVLLQLIILFLPTQLGWHFWPDFSRAAGIKVDYLSPTLYFTDILLLLYIFSSFPKVHRWLKDKFIPFLILVSFIVINIYFSISPLNAFFWWLRILEYLSFFLCLRLQKVSWSKIKNTLLLSTLVVIFLQIVQQIHQASLGGLFYWLGERSYSFSTPGLARISLFGQEFLRSPSVFSHPNSFAGYLLVVCYLLNVYKSPVWQRITLFLSLLLTFSKGALLAYLLVFILQIKSTSLISIFLVFSFLQPFLPSLPNSAEFISDRLFFMSSVKKFFFSHSLFGVGLGGFIPALGQSLSGSFLTPAKLQPVHNLFLLSLSEFGLLGTSLFSFFLYKTRRLLGKPKLFGLFALVAITGTFDHYWWTLPQNRLILLLATAILL